MKALFAAFDVIPGALWALLLAGALGLVGVQSVRIAGVKSDVATQRASTAEARTDLANYKAAAAESARLADRAERVEEQRRTAAQGKALDEAHTRAQAAQTAADRYRRSADGLQQRLAATVAAARAARGDPAAAGSGAPAGDPKGVLGDVLGRCKRRVGLLARYADAARIAGQACEASYDALIAPSR